MILEVAILNVKPGSSNLFEEAFTKAEVIISSSKGYVGHSLQKCIEVENQYILLVNWQTLEDHVEAFRGNEPYQNWKKLLHHFYDPFPVVQHYSTF